jgi:hypothetical protein
MLGALEIDLFLSKTLMSFTIEESKPLARESKKYLGFLWAEGSNFMGTEEVRD